MTGDAENDSFLDETTDDLLEQSQQNAQALILGTISLLDDLGVVPEAWADGLGERFAAAWSDEDSWEPSEFLDAMLTNYRSLGAEVEESDLESDPVTAVISGFPDEDLCEVFGIDPKDAGIYHRVAAEIARRRNLVWTWTSYDDLTTFTVTAAGAVEPK
jgi:hypothetical protein